MRSDIRGDPQQSLDFFKMALSSNMYGEQEAREQLAQLAAQYAQANIPTDLKQQFAGNWLKRSCKSKKRYQSPGCAIPACSRVSCLIRMEIMRTL